MSLREEAMAVIGDELLHYNGKCQDIKVGWRVYASKNCVIIGSDKGVLPKCEIDACRITVDPRVFAIRTVAEHARSVFFNQHRVQFLKSLALLGWRPLNQFPPFR